MAEAMLQAREALPEVETLSEAYRLLDGLASATAQAYPTSLCQAGCGACCQYPTGLFTIAAKEWRHIEAHLAQDWSAERRLAFAKEAMKSYGGFWQHLVLLAQSGFLEMLAVLPLFTLAGKACPFLKQGRCSIYAVRPYACRAFGLTAVRAGLAKQPRLYACPMQGEALWKAMAEGGPAVQLPVVNPIVRRIRQLSPGPRSAIPMWVVAWAKKELAAQAQPG